jgi:Cof subfamily protein (haloacid dehalogenase superfamily)
MPYRLVVADLDGTLLGDEVVMSPAVLNAVARIMELGGYFSVATGRTLSGARPHARRLRINAPAILYQGAEIRDIETGAVIFQASIPLPIAQELIAFAVAEDVPLNVYVDDQVFTRERTAGSDFYATLNAIEVKAVGDLSRFLDRPPTKMLLVSDPERLDPLAPRLKAQFAGRLQIVRSHRRFLEAIPFGVNKGRGLERLAGYLGIAQAETVALGDNDNDAEMVAWAGLGIAMGNGSAATKAAADVIAPPVEQDGAAWAIERYVLPALGGCMP